VPIGFLTEAERERLDSFPAQIVLSPRAGTSASRATTWWSSFGKGVTFYTWTADQFSQCGTKVVATTVRDATYVLDEIVENETELPILEHATDCSRTRGRSG
jgi:TnpA family transposase